MRAVPQVILDALEGYTPSVVPADRAIAVGDIRTVTNPAEPGERRLLLVVGMTPSRGIAQVVLTHSYPEYATGEDIVVPSSASNVKYPIVVEGGLMGVVWLKDLGPLVATVPESVVVSVDSYRRNTDLTDGCYFGVELTGPFDARYDFKVSELDTLQGIVAHATSVMLEQLDDPDYDCPDCIAHNAHNET